MKSKYVLSFLSTALILLSGNLRAQTADLAPERFGDVILHATRTASTGGMTSTGTFTALFTSGGMDYTFSLGGTGFDDDAAAYTYTKTSATTATIAEAFATIDLTFTSATAGTFLATFPSIGGTQSGTFELEEINLTPQFVNLSTRTPLAAGATVIPGFVVNGPGTTRVLIRAVGPGLLDYDVLDALADPKITIYKGDEIVATNDNWDADAAEGMALSAAFASTGAFPLGAGSKDAALLLTLEPGAYTAVVSSVDPMVAGEVIVEVYAVR